VVVSLLFDDRTLENDTCHAGDDEQDTPDAERSKRDSG